MSSSATIAGALSRRLIPVVTIADPGQAQPLGLALKAGGLPIAEITLRTAAGLEAIRRMSEDPDLLVGAGTVTDQQQADSVYAAGARFIVSPGVRPDLVRHCQELGIPIFPGAVTPTEVMTAQDCGIGIVKFFPAKQFGGLSTIAALSAPFTGVKFIPTGGIDGDTAGSYLAHPAVVAVGGSWMVAPSLLAEEAFDVITQLTAEAVRRCAAPAPTGSGGR